MGCSLFSTGMAVSLFGALFRSEILLFIGLILILFAILRRQSSKELANMFFVRALGWEKGELVVEIRVLPKEHKRVSISIPASARHQWDNLRFVMADGSEKTRIELSLSPGVELVFKAKGKPRFEGKVPFEILCESETASTTVRKIIDTRKPPLAEGPRPLKSAHAHPEPQVLVPSDPVKQLEQDYASFELIGEGGFAKVYKAVRKRDNAVVALKILTSVDRPLREAFLNEVGVWKSLGRHAHIVEFYHADFFPVPYIEMEYCQKSLKGEKLPMPEEEALKVILQVGSALKYAHSRGILHLDIKPANVLGTGNLWKVSDWGLARRLWENSISKGEVVTGTLLYLAPEQFDSRFGKKDERTDIYQLGVLGYELLSGKNPQFAESPGEIVEKVLHGKPEPIKGVSEKTNEIILRALEKEKGKRWGSVGEMLSEITKLLGVAMSASGKYTKGGLLVELLKAHVQTGETDKAMEVIGDLREHVTEAGKELLEELKEEIKWRSENQVAPDSTLILRVERLKKLLR